MFLAEFWWFFGYIFFLFIICAVSATAKNCRSSYGDFSTKIDLGYLFLGSVFKILIVCKFFFLICLILLDETKRKKK